MGTHTELSRLTPLMKMADLMNLNSTLPGVLTRMGIPFGFGEESVGEVCHRQGIDPDTFLLICCVHAFPGYPLTRERLRKASLGDVLKYLNRSHAYYMDVALKDLSSALVALTEPCGERHRNTLRRFFTEYKNELFKHLEYEEGTVFPQAEAALRTGHSDTWEYAQCHSHMEEKLEDLKSLVMKYMPPECGQQDICRALSCIFTLQEDLSKHVLVEDAVLAPMVGQREPSLLENRDTPAPGEGDSLSDREKEILVAVAKGMLNKEIADAYSISIHTVIAHRRNITRKTGIKTVAGLTVYALLNNLIDINTIE